MNWAFRKERCTAKSRNLTWTKCLAFVAIFSWGVVSGCGPYSFSGAAIPAEVKTVKVAFFPNKADLVVPQLSPEFTEQLRDKFVRETRLSLVQENGDLEFSGAITGYRYSTQTVSGATERASESKLTLNVKVRYANNAEPENNFERNFSQFVTFEANQNPAAIEEELINQVSERLIQDIFNATVNNW